jgi:ClpP class serine protease
MPPRLVGSREMLAIEPSALHRGADGFFWLTGPETPPNARHAVFGDVAIVHVRGSLEHHLAPGVDSYEGTLAKLEAAMICDDAPAGVIMCIDSRGGVVAGLNETVDAIVRLRTRAKVPLVAYVNEMAASAAYALACAAEEIVGPESCITGSIGTISTMISCARQDEMTGIDVELITSGARKSDGHPHVKITDAAREAERDRVEKLAASFFALASESRGVPIKKLQAMQAAIFLGPDAKARGLLDSILSIDDVAKALSKGGSGGVRAKGNETDRRA